MKFRLRSLLPGLALLFIPFSMFATHNRAGEIHVEQIGPLTVRVTIITWTKASSVNADRDTLTLDWGDDFRQQVVRTTAPATRRKASYFPTTSNTIHTLLPTCMRVPARTAFQ